MPFSPDREYRSFSLMQPVADETAGYIVEGYATTFDEPYDFGYGGAKERIARSALATADMSDVIFQLNHTGTVMARMRNNTLTLGQDDHGLYVKADLGGSQAGRDLYESIKNGLIDRMSWGFIIAEDGWEWDEATRTSTITKVDKVFDVSANACRSSTAMPSCPPIASISSTWSALVTCVREKSSAAAFSCSKSSSEPLTVFRMSR